jgi:hypothetical protein
MISFSRNSASVSWALSSQVYEPQSLARHASTTELHLWPLSVLCVGSQIFIPLNAACAFHWIS